MAQFMLISALLVASFMCFVQGQSSCECISLYYCKPLLAIVRKPNKSSLEVNILRRAQCGFEGHVPKVFCCASPPAPVPTSDACFTADGQEGKCTGLYSCPHVAKLLRPPVQKNAVTYVQNSKCNGPDQYSVCCGQSAPDFNMTTSSFIGSRLKTPVVNAVCKSTIALPDPQSRCCGIDSYTSDRIVGGASTSIDQYPWLTIIEYVKDDDETYSALFCPVNDKIEYLRVNRIKLLCGGSLISGRYVLTAGHCVLGSILDCGTPRNVRLGEYDITNDVKAKDCVVVPGGGEDCTPGVTVIPIEKIIPHPEYKPSHPLRRHDIALLRLTQLAPYGDFIRPICLPQQDVTISPPQDFLLRVAGWGAINTTHFYSDRKRHVDVPYFTRGQCQPAYSMARRKVELWNGQLCAGGEKGKDSCKGDSGGPLMYENKKVFEVIGVVSFGPTPCGREDVPGVYTKVFEYNTWIRSNIVP